MAMQATLIGWIPAAIWAWKIVHRKDEKPIAEPHSSEPSSQKTQSPKSKKTT